MAYKRISPMPIIEGGTNASSYATNFGTSYFDGTRLVVTDTGAAGEVLTSQGVGMPPVFMANTGMATFFAGIGIGNYFPVGAAQEIPLCSAGSTSSPFYCPVNGTISNLFVYASTNTMPSDKTVTVNINGMNTSIVATVTASTTGVFSDVVNSAAVVIGDIIGFEFEGGGSGSIAVNAFIAFTP